MAARARRCGAVAYLLAAALMLAPASAPCAAAADPLPAGPLVPMREILSGDAYAAAARAILGTIDRSALTVTAVDTGIGIVTMNSGSPAEKLGIKVGDIITACDGTAVRSVDHFLHLRGNDRVFTMQVLTPGKGERAVTAGPGKIGVTIADWAGDYEYLFSHIPWMLDLTYMHGPGRDPRFDDDMLVACQSADSDEDVCETALAHIQLLGGHPEPFFYLACAVDFHRGRFAEAIAYGEAALAAAADDGCRLRIAHTLCDLCTVSDHMERARELIQRFNITLGRDEQSAALGKRLAITSAYPPSGIYPFSSRALALIKDAPIAPVSTLTDEFLPNIDGRTVQVGNDFHCDAPKRDFAHIAFFTPTARNVCLGGTVTYRHSPGRDPAVRYTDGFQFGLTEAVAGHAQESYSVLLLNRGARGIMPGLYGDLNHIAVRLGPEVPIRFRIAMIDNRIEAEVGGVCVLRASTIEDQAERKMGFFFDFGAGLTTDVTEVTWKVGDVLGPPLPRSGMGRGADDF